MVFYAVRRKRKVGKRSKNEISKPLSKYNSKIGDKRLLRVKIPVRRD